MAFKKIVADYEKASGNTIDYSIMPFAPLRQKIVSAVTSGVVPDLFHDTPAEIIALNAWDDKLVDVSDVVETQQEEFTETALLNVTATTASTKSAAITACLIHRRRFTEPYLAATGREGRLQDGGHPEDLGCLSTISSRTCRRSCVPRACATSMASVFSSPRPATTATTCSTIS